MAKGTTRRQSIESVDAAQAVAHGIGTGIDGAVKGGGDVAETISHFHYAPTAFALFPVLASLVVGSDLTDLMLLLLVAIYLQKCVTVPAEYYKHCKRRYTSVDTSELSDSQQQAIQKQKNAELQAFVGLVVGPLLGAFLLSYVRTIMGRPANGLISNFNITIFVLAAEMRPINIALNYLNARSDRLHEEVHDVPPSKYEALSARFETLVEDFSTLQEQLTTTEGAGRNSRYKQKSHGMDEHTDMEAVKSALRHFERQSTQDKKLFRAQLHDLSMRLDKLEHREPDSTRVPATNSSSTSLLSLPLRLCYRCWLLFTFPIRALQHAGH